MRRGARVTCVQVPVGPEGRRGMKRLHDPHRPALTFLPEITPRKRQRLYRALRVRVPAERPESDGEQLSYRRAGV